MLLGYGSVFYHHVVVVCPLCHWMALAHCEFPNHVFPTTCCHVWPLVNALGSLQEAGVIGLFQGLVGLRDEGRRPLDALLAVGYLLRKLPKPLRLERMTNGERGVWAQSCSNGSGQGCVTIIKPWLECSELLWVRTENTSHMVFL